MVLIFGECLFFLKRRPAQNGSVKCVHLSFNLLPDRISDIRKQNNLGGLQSPTLFPYQYSRLYYKLQFFVRIVRASFVLLHVGRERSSFGRFNNNSQKRKHLTFCRSFFHDLTGLFSLSLPHPKLSVALYLFYHLLIALCITLQSRISQPGFRGRKLDFPERSFEKEMNIVNIKMLFSRFPEI